MAARLPYLDLCIKETLRLYPALAFTTRRAARDTALGGYYVPQGAVVENEDEDDADPIDNGWIDLGEVTAETLALDLDPYPRKPGEAFAEHIEDTGEPAGRESPFAVLAKRKL